MSSPKIEALDPGVGDGRRGRILLVTEAGGGRDGQARSTTDSWLWGWARVGAPWPKSSTGGDRDVIALRPERAATLWAHEWRARITREAVGEGSIIPIVKRSTDLGGSWRTQGRQLRHEVGGLYLARGAGGGVRARTPTGLHRGHPGAARRCQR